LYLVAAQTAATLVLFSKFDSPSRTENEASVESKLRNRKGSEADEVMSETESARPRAQQLASFKPRNISQPPAHLFGCGRDGHSPQMQKFNFGVRVESIYADSTGQNAFRVKTGLANK
jgi:hypothetical protein